MSIKSPPQNELELMTNANELAGKTLAEIAEIHEITLPKNLLQAKGFVGQVIELHLGANSDNKPEPDFQHLGIELKTLPLNKKLQPKESTYVCTAPLSLDAALETWETSRLRKKLLKVLWVPIEADDSINLADRKIGSPFLMSLDPTHEKILREDWEELMEMLHLGRITELSAHQGVYLQIRPKAAHSQILIPALNDEGEKNWVGPKGFYLRTQFTSELLKRYFL
jgi:DNA mismatch repair protein MutH